MRSLPSRRLELSCASKTGSNSLYRPPTKSGVSICLWQGRPTITHYCFYLGEDGPELSSQSVRIPIQSEQVCREDLAFDLSKQSSLAEEAASDDIVMRGATYGEGFVASSRSPPRVLECPLASFDELSTFSGSVSSSISSGTSSAMGMVPLILFRGIVLTAGPFQIRFVRWTVTVFQSTRAVTC